MPLTGERKRRATREAMRRYRARRRAGQLPGLLLPVEETEAGATDAPRSKLVDVPGGDALQWIEDTLLVPSGPLRGKPFRLGDWQRRFIEDAMQPGIREAALCVARKNGKTGLVAALVLAHLAGPWCRPDWRGLVASLTADLAIELRTAVMTTAELSGLPSIQLMKSPRPGAVIGLNGSHCQFLATDRGTGHAKGADLAIIDEAGLMAETERDTWNAMISSTSGRDGRLMVISILGDGPMMAELRDRADDPAVCWHGYTTEVTDDPTIRDTWLKANPGLIDGIKSEAYMRDMARRASVNPGDMSAFRAYDLNSPANPNRVMLVTVEQYAEARRDPPARDGDCVVGVDLGGSSSMTAAAAYWHSTGRLEVRAALPGVPDLRSRSLADGVGTRYERMAERGELTIYPGVRVTPVAPFLSEFLADVGAPVAVVADRYRMSEAEDVYAALGLGARQVWRGQGWMDASADVRAFQREVIDGRLAVGHNLLLESAIMESSLAIDPAGNQKLDKARSRGRIDAASAAVLAVGEAVRIANRPAGEGRYLGLV